jgi:hypothetical protein
VNVTEYYFTKTEAKAFLEKPDKSTARYFLKSIAAILKKFEAKYPDEALHVPMRLFIDKDPAGIDFVVTMVLSIYALRDEIMKWSPGQILSKKEEAQITLRELAANIPDVDMAMELISGLFVVEEGRIDFIGFVMDAVNDLGDELIAWHELSTGAVRS